MLNKNKMRKQFIRDAGYKPSEEELIDYIKNQPPIDTNKQNNNTGGIPSGILLIIWFVVSIFSLFYLSSMDKGFEMGLVFGHYFLVFGLMAYFSSKKVDQDRTLKILFSVGLVFVLYMDFFAGRIKINMDPDMFLFLVLGLIFFVTGLILFRNAFNSDNDPSMVGVNAIVCDYVKSKGGTVACVFEFEFNGKNYKIKDNYFTNVNIPKIGTIKNIKINPENPEEIRTPGPGLMLLLIAVPFILMGGLFIYVSLFFE